MDDVRINKIREVIERMQSVSTSPYEFQAQLEAILQEILNILDDLTSPTPSNEK